MYQHERILDDLHFCQKLVFNNNDESHFFEPSYIILPANMGFPCVDFRSLASIFWHRPFVKTIFGLNANLHVKFEYIQLLLQVELM